MIHDIPGDKQRAYRQNTVSAKQKAAQKIISQLQFSFYFLFLLTMKTMRRMIPITPMDIIPARTNGKDGASLSWKDKRFGTSAKQKSGRRRKRRIKMAETGRFIGRIGILSLKIIFLQVFPKFRGERITNYSPIRNW
jgi:hypothetical protein